MQKNRIFTVFGLSFAIAILYKLLKIMLIIGIFYITSYLSITDNTLIFIADSLIRFIILFLLLLITYKIINKVRNKYNVWFFAFFIFCFLVVQMLFHIFSIIIRGGAFDISSVIPDIEFIAPTLLFAYYYFIKKQR